MVTSVVYMSYIFVFYFKSQNFKRMKLEERNKNGFH